MEKTHWKKLDNPNYLAAYSLMDGQTREIVVTIDKVVVEEVKTDRGAEQCKVAYIKGQKPMILNVTNCKAIQKAYDSPYIEDWAGKSITLYVAKIKAFGDVVDALRVKPERPVVTLPELKPGHDKWESAKKAISEGSYELADVLKNIRFQIKTKSCYVQNKSELMQ